MKQIIRSIINEFMEWEIPQPIEREVSFPEFPPNVRKVHILMGVRRSGKTWVLYQKMRSLIRGGNQKVPGLNDRNRKNYHPLHTLLEMGSFNVNIKRRKLICCSDVFGGINFINGKPTIQYLSVVA
jgi:hypothetical protein